MSFHYTFSFRELSHTAAAHIPSSSASSAIRLEDSFGNKFLHFIIVYILSLKYIIETVFIFSMENKRKKAYFTCLRRTRNINCVFHD